MAPLPIFDTSPREMIEIDDDFVEVKRPESIISLSEDEEGSPARFMFGKSNRLVDLLIEHMLTTLEEDISDDSNDDVFEEVDDADWRERQAERQASSLLPPGHTFEDSVSFGFVTLTPGMTPELQDGDFLRIKHIVRDLTIDRPTQAVYLHGKRLRRCRKVENMLQKKLNELCMLVEDDLTDSRPAEQQELVKIPLEDVICVREVIFTNLLFPALSFRQTGLCYRSALAIEEQAVLVCRWKYTTEYDTPPGRSNGYVVQRALTRLSDDECDPNRGKSDVLLRRDWRMIAQEKEDTKQKQALKALAKEGSVSSVPSLTAHMVDLTVDDRSPVPKKRSRDIIEIDSSDDDMEIIETTKTIKRKTRDGVYERRKVTTESFKPSRRSTSTGTLLGIPPQQQQLVVKLKYTYGDMCAGAGGTTRGAMMAGLNFAWVLDHWDRACDTQRRNFPGGTVLEMDIHEYCTTEMEVRLVDVLHISFPCQPHSPIHTREGRNDGANMAAGYSAVPILLKSRPRVITLEQTPGIMTHRGGWHFRALINQLTSVNYSVRWKIMNFAEYGNSQPRKRLIIIASW